MASPGCAIPWIALVAALSACATPFDLDRMRSAVVVSSPHELAADAESALPFPEGLRAVSGELRAVPLKWDPLLSGEVGGYVVERARDRDGPFERIAVVPGRFATEYVDRGALGRPVEPTVTNAARDAVPPVSARPEEPVLGDGTTRFYRVRAYDAHDRPAAAASQVAAATTAPAPAPPDGLRAYSHQPRQVPLSWEASLDPNVTGYAIDRSPSYGGPFEVVSRPEGRYTSTWVDHGLGDLRVFYYRVAARSAAGATGEPSDPVRAVTKPEPLPPVGLRVVERRLGANRVAWQPNVERDVVAYRLVRMREGSESPELVGSVARDAPWAEDPGVAADETLSYAVVAVDRDGLESGASRPISVESVGYELRATARPDGVHLSWNPRSDEGYRGARVMRSGLLGPRVLGFSETGGFVDTDAREPGSYRYTVILLRPDGTQAPPSSPVEIDVPDA